MNVCSAEEDDLEDQGARDRLQIDKGGEATNQEEFDFVVQPSEDFFCPVTFELLLNPHQTTCCGHHLSEKAVNRLQREGKPCPMCKESKLVTIPDKFFKRKASAILIRCPYKGSECEWVGEVGGAKQHTTACPKRPWECEHCDFTSTFDVGIQHIEQCTKYPVPCPNKCDVGTVPRCDVEKHRTECPLEPVACQFSDVGCSMKVARKDLKLHMEESQQQHLLSATLLNLKLTKETIAELNRQLIEKDQQLDKKDQQLTQVLLEKDKSIAEKDKIIAEKESQLSELQTEFKKNQQEFVDSTKVALECVLGINSYQFVLKNFSRCQKCGHEGDWFSDPFSVSGCDLKLNVETKELEPNMKIRIYPISGTFQRSVTYIATLQLLNQLGDHSHHFKKIVVDVKEGCQLSEPYNFITFKVLYRKDATIQYLMDDSLKLRLLIKEGHD
jgi:uncharacterized coiled-coil protein SlyX